MLVLSSTVASHYYNCWKVVHVEAFHKKLQVKSGLMWRRMSNMEVRQFIVREIFIRRWEYCKSPPPPKKIGLSDYSEAQKHKILIIKRDPVVYMKYKTMKKCYA
jgi:hypothetical protein